MHPDIPITLLLTICCCPHERPTKMHKFRLCSNHQLHPSVFFPALKRATLLGVLKIFFALEKSFDSNYDALLGSAPAIMASPGCDCAVLPVCNRGEISRLGNAEESQCAPAPNGGQGWRKGEIITSKEDFYRAKNWYDSLPQPGEKRSIRRPAFIKRVSVWIEKNRAGNE